MSCCCNSGGRAKKSNASCLGRCDIPKHKCFKKMEVKPGPIPRHMGWLYTAKDAPAHQLRCGWRPGHVFCPVLRTIELHNCSRAGKCYTCSCSCGRCMSCCGD